MIQRGGRPEFHTAGVAQLGTSRRWHPGDHMRLASTSKAFSGAVALSLVAEGKLSLDDQIGSVLPWLPKAWQGVTVAEALRPHQRPPRLQQLQAVPLGPRQGPPRLTSRRGG